MKKKKVIRIVVIVLVFLFISNSVATKIIYDSVFARYDRKEEPAPLSDERYADLLNGREIISVSMEDETLNSYFYDVQDEKGMMIIAPGLHAGADDYIPVVDFFFDAGYDVFAFDPLGCVGSSGKSPRGFSQEVYDLKAVLEYVRANYPGEDIYIFGHSRGGYAATAILDTDEDIKGVVSVSGLNSAMEAIIAFSAKYVGKVANLNYPSLWAYQAMLFGPKMMGIKSQNTISESSVPVLVVQGAEDTTAPKDQYSIYSHENEITGDNCIFYLYSKPEHCGHTDLMYDGDGINKEVFDYILEEFLDNCLDEGSLENAS